MKRALALPVDLLSQQSVDEDLFSQSQGVSLDGRFDTEHNIQKSSLFSPRSLTPPRGDRSAAKRASRATGYSLGKRDGLVPFLKFYGLTPAQFAENLTKLYLANPPAEWDEPPRAATASFVRGDGRLATEERVLEAAAICMAYQIAAHPVRWFCCPSQRQSVCSHLNV